MALQLGKQEVRKDLVTFTANINDFLPGVNYKTFYLGMTYDNGAISPTAFPETFASEDNETSASENGATFSKEIDLDFDYLIESNRIIGGNFIATIELKGTENSGNVEFYSIIRVTHVDGGTAAEINLGFGKTNTGTTTGLATKSVTGTLAKQNFTEGDILRITLEGWIKSSVTDAANNVKVKHDGSIYNIKIPFINLDEY